MFEAQYIESHVSTSLTTGRQKPERHVCCCMIGSGTVAKPSLGGMEELD